jgi:hypothetical protein
MRLSDLTKQYGGEEMQCRDCEEEIIRKRIKRGFADQCDECALEAEEVAKYLGFNDGSLNKSTNTSIYRGDDENVRKKIANQLNRVH